MESFAQGIVIDIDPVVVVLGPFALRWYGIAVAIAITAGLCVALREGRWRGLDDDSLYACALWAMLGGILGARILHIVDKLDFYLQNPRLLLSIAQGGLAMWGAIIGGILTVVVYCRLRSLPTARVLDAAAPALVVGQIIGRIGSLVNGDSWGAATDLPWGVIYLHRDALLPPTSLGVPTHPYPVYEMIWSLLTLGLLVALRLRLRREGSLFLAYLSAQSIGRFALTFVREENIAFFGLQQAQVVAVLVMVIALPWLAYRLDIEAGGRTT